MSSVVNKRSEAVAQRRAARAASNRGEMLDAAERVFADRGVDGSIRQIAEESGFSPAAIYTYFENKDELFAVTLSRRGSVLLDTITAAATSPGDALERLHAIVDASVAFFADHDDFRKMLRHVRSADATIPAIVLPYTGDYLTAFSRTMDLMLAIIEEGQKKRIIRTGSPNALLHFYMTLVYEHVFLAVPGTEVALTLDEFHGLVDGALRRPSKR